MHEVTGAAEMKRLYAKLAEDAEKTDVPGMELSTVHKAEAHLCLALYYLQLASQGITDPRAAEQKARAAAERALDLDPGHAEALVALAQTAIWHDYDWAAAERYYQRARTLAPNLAQVANSYAALYLRPLGRLEEALAESDRALALAPLPIPSKPLPISPLNAVYAECCRCRAYLFRMRFRGGLADTDAAASWVWHSQ